MSKKNKILHIDNEQHLKKIFVNIYEENFERLIRYAFSITKEKGLAEDVVSQVFANLWDKKDRLHKIREVRLARGVTWFDTGSFDDLLSASNFIKIVEKKQAQKIGCIEESAYDAKLIDKKKFEDLIKDTVNTDLKYYLKAILSGRFDQ